MAKVPCKAMGHDDRETGHDCKDPHRTTSEMVVAIEGEIDIGMAF